MLGTKKNRLLYIVVLVVGFAIVGLIATGKPRPVAKPIRVQPVPLVDILQLKPGNNPLWIETQGVVQPKTQIELVAQVSGKVIAVHPQFAAGGVFEADTALVEIEAADYRIAISQAQAQLADAQQLLATEQGRARQAKREWRDVGSQQANDLFLRKPQLASAQANVAAAKASLEKAQLDLARTKISAPFDGRVLTKQVGLGQFVSAGTPVAEVYSTDIAEVRLPLTARQKQRLGLPVNQSAPVKIISRYGDSEYTWPAELSRVEGAIDSDSRQYFVVARVNNPFIRPTASSSVGTSPPALSVGEFVTAEVAGGGVSNSFVIPRTALRQEQQIWLMQQGELHFASVEVIKTTADSALVKLRDPAAYLHSDGSLALVVSPLSLALNGMKIRQRGAPLEQSAQTVAQPQG